MGNREKDPLKDECRTGSAAMELPSNKEMDAGKKSLRTSHNGIAAMEVPPTRKGVSGQDSTYG